MSDHLQLTLKNLGIGRRMRIERFTLCFCVSVWLTWRAVAVTSYDAMNSSSPVFEIPPYDFTWRLHIRKPPSAEGVKLKRFTDFINDDGLPFVTHYLSSTEDKWKIKYHNISLAGRCLECFSLSLSLTPYVSVKFILLSLYPFVCCIFTDVKSWITANSLFLIVSVLCDENHWSHL